MLHLHADLHASLAVGCTCTRHNVAWCVSFVLLLHTQHIHQPCRSWVGFKVCTTQHTAMRLLLLALPLLLLPLLLLPQRLVFCSQLLNAGQQVAACYQQILLQQFSGC